MFRAKYEIKINAPISEVFDKMLGIGDKSNYEHWTSPFSPSSSYDGVWGKGAKMYFTSRDESGHVHGMISEIVKFEENAHVSIRHIGMLKSGVEITSGPEVDPWSGAIENYSFKEIQDSSLVAIELDIEEKYKESMREMYNAALGLLKELCEQ